METNTYKAFRLKFIENCLRNNMRDYTKEMILEELNNQLSDFGESRKISESTLNQDLAYISKSLSTYDRKIKKWKKGKQCFYRYDDTDFSMHETDLTKADIKKLVNAIKLLKTIKGIDLNNELLDILQKLDTHVKYHKQLVNAISVSEAITANGYEYADDLYEAIQELTVVEITYKPFNEISDKIIIHPYHLRQYNNRWFLFGYDEKRKDISTLALDRIERIRPLNKTYQLPDDIFEVTDYFKDIIGVTRYTNKPVEDIQLQFSANRAPYIITKPLHSSQQVTKNKDGSILVSLQLIRNKELEQLILGFGKDAIVKQPESLRMSIKQQAEEIAKQYQPDPKKIIKRR